MSPQDPQAWMRANPPLVIRVTDIETERRALDERTFVVEHLEAGNWPTPEAGDAR